MFKTMHILVYVLLLALTLFLLPFYLYELTGRGKIEDFIGPFISLLLFVSAIYICARIKQKVVSWLISFILIVVSSIFAILFSHFNSIGSYITGDDLNAIYQANVEETVYYIKDFFINFKNLSLALLSGIVTVLTCIFTYRLGMRKEAVRKRFYVVGLIICVLGGSLIFYKIKLVRFYNKLHEEYITQVQAIKKISDSLKLSSNFSAYKTPSDMAGG